MEKSQFTRAGRALAQLLVAARRTAGLSQVELARRLGKPQPFVSNIERGERRVDIVEFCEIARVLDVEPSDLFAAFVEAASRD